MPVSTMPICAAVMPMPAGRLASSSVLNLRVNSLALATPTKHLNWSAVGVKSRDRLASIHGIARCNNSENRRWRSAGLRCSRASISGSLSSPSSLPASAIWRSAMRTTLRNSAGRPSASASIGNRACEPPTSLKASSAHSRSTAGPGMVNGRSLACTGISVACSLRRSLRMMLTLRSNCSSMSSTAWRPSWNSPTRPFHIGCPALSTPVFCPSQRDRSRISCAASRAALARKWNFRLLAISVESWSMISRA